MPLADARALISRSEFAAAQHVLRDALSRTSPDPELADDEDADTAAVYAGVLLHVGEPHTAKAWSGYAYRALHRLRGGSDRRTLHALGLLALALQRSGAFEEAARHYHELISELSEVEGPDGDRTLAAYADAAVVEHARGMCASARSTLSDVIAAYTAKHGPEHPVTLRMTIRLAAMWRDCGDFSRAQQLLAHARALTVTHPPEHEVHRLIADAFQVAPDPGHHCGLPSTSDDREVAYRPAPEFPAISRQPAVPEYRPEPASALDYRPMTPQVDPDEWPDDELFGAAPSTPATPWPATTPPGSPDQPFALPTQPDQPFALPAGPGQPGHRQQPSHIQQSVMPVLPTAPVARPSAPEHRATPAQVDPATAGPAVPEYRPVAGPPAVPSTPEYRPAPDQWPDDEIFERRKPQPHPHPRQAPALPERQWEARREQVDPGVRKGLIAVVAASIATIAVAVIVTVALTGRDKTPPQPEPTASARLNAPVANLRLEDKGDSLLIAWVYPPTAGGPVIVSAGPAGEPMRALQSLPAGSESYTLPGLDPKRNYCVAVTVAYRADQTVMSQPVCTQRQ